jgi:hypothetical protein
LLNTGNQNFLYIQASINHPEKRFSVFQSNNAKAGFGRKIKMYKPTLGKELDQRNFRAKCYPKMISTSWRKAKLVEIIKLPFLMGSN